MKGICAGFEPSCLRRSSVDALVDEEPKTRLMAVGDANAAPIWLTARTFVAHQKSVTERRKRLGKLPVHLVGQNEHRLCTGRSTDEFFHHRGCLYMYVICQHKHVRDKKGLRVCFQKFPSTMHTKKHSPRGLSWSGRWVSLGRCRAICQTHPSSFGPD